MSRIKAKFKKTQNVFCKEKETRLCHCENDFSFFKKNREEQIYDRLKCKKYSANNMWTEPLTLFLLRSFLCIPYTIYVDNNPTGIKPRSQHQLLYHTLLYDQLSIDGAEVVYNKLIQNVTKSWINEPKPYTHFFVCDYITTIEEFLTYSSLKSKFTNCKFGGVFESVDGKEFVGTRDLDSFFRDIKRLGIFTKIYKSEKDIKEFSKNNVTFFYHNYVKAVKECLSGKVPDGLYKV